MLRSPAIIGLALLCSAVFCSDSHEPKRSKKTGAVDDTESLYPVILVPSVAAPHGLPHGSPHGPATMDRGSDEGESEADDMESEIESEGGSAPAPPPVKGSGAAAPIEVIVESPSAAGHGGVAPPPDPAGYGPAGSAATVHTVVIGEPVQTFAGQLQFRNAPSAGLRSQHARPYSAQASGKAPCCSANEKIVHSHPEPAAPAPERPAASHIHSPVVPSSVIVYPVDKPRAYPRGYVSSFPNTFNKQVNIVYPPKQNPGKPEHVRPPPANLIIPSHHQQMSKQIIPTEPHPRFPVSGSSLVYATAMNLFSHPSYRVANINSPKIGILVQTPPGSKPMPTDNSFRYNPVYPSVLPPHPHPNNRYELPHLTMPPAHVQNTPGIHVAPESSSSEVPSSPIVATKAPAPVHPEVPQPQVQQPQYPPQHPPTSNVQYPLPLPTSHSHHHYPHQPSSSSNEQYAHQSLSSHEQYPHSAPSPSQHSHHRPAEHVQYPQPVPTSPSQHNPAPLSSQVHYPQPPSTPQQYPEPAPTPQINYPQPVPTPHARHEPHPSQQTHHIPNPTHPALTVPHRAISDQHSPMCSQETGMAYCLTDHEYPTAEINAYIAAHPEKFELLRPMVPWKILHQTASHRQPYGTDKPVPYASSGPTAAAYLSSAPESHHSLRQTGAPAQGNGEMCVSHTQASARLFRATNEHDKWKVVVHLPDACQTSHLETCDRNKTCRYVDHLVQTQCVQEFVLQQMMVYSAEFGLHVDEMKIPRGCRCRIMERIPGTQPPSSSAPLHLSAY